MEDGRAAKEMERGESFRFPLPPASTPTNPLNPVAGSRQPITRPGLGNFTFFAPETNRKKNRQTQLSPAIQKKNIIKPTKTQFNPSKIKKKTKKLNKTW